MKLIQYRFTSEAFGKASLVGKAVQALFEKECDLNLRAIYVERGEPDRLAVRMIDAGCVGEVITKSFIQSYSDVVDYSEYASLKSNTSCRFVIIEDNGLLRVCHAQDDTSIDFAGLLHTAEDVSELLIKSDLFD